MIPRHPVELDLQAKSLGRPHEVARLSRHRRTGHLPASVGELDRVGPAAKEPADSTLSKATDGQRLQFSRRATQRRLAGAEPGRWQRSDVQHAVLVVVGDKRHPAR